MITSLHINGLFYSAWMKKKHLPHSACAYIFCNVIEQKSCFSCRRKTFHKRL
uniref:Uncharacterized protein n=1 Tax=Anguilla anguilla TaxID=7936 RepID=A0A0E9WIF6_ANGAN